MKLLYPLFLLENYFLTLLSAYLNFFPARKKREIIFSTPQTSILIQPPFFPTLLPRKKGALYGHTTRSHMAWKRRRKRNSDGGARALFRSSAEGGWRFSCSRQRKGGGGGGTLIRCLSYYCVVIPIFLQRKLCIPTSADSRFSESDQACYFPRFFMQMCMGESVRLTLRANRGVTDQCPS